MVLASAGCSEETRAYKATCRSVIACSFLRTHETSVSGFCSGSPLGDRGQASAGHWNYQCIGGLEELLVEAVRLKHGQHLQGLSGPMKLLGHEQLPDPEEWGLRGPSLGCEAGRDAGLQHEREGRSAGSLSYTPSLTPFS